MKEDKRIQFAIGVAVLILAIKWIFSQTLSDAYLSYTAIEEDPEKLKNPMDFWAMIMPIVDIFIASMVGIGAYVIRSSEWLFGRIKDISPVVETGDLIKDFARAAAINDEEKLINLRIQIRRPYAIGELTEAITNGDRSKANSLFEELTQ